MKDSNLVFCALFLVASAGVGADEVGIGHDHNIPDASSPETSSFEQETAAGFWQELMEWLVIETGED